MLRRPLAFWPAVLLLRRTANLPSNSGGYRTKTLFAAVSMTDNLLTVAINLLQARANQMLTETSWEALAQAVWEETGRYVQWRTYDDLKAE